ncbi:MAG: glycosyltransferase [Methylacidiphilales bacterium]|nr:glycosyltransferase [Candidatus Methylacidiphilales bacterium]
MLVKIILGLWSFAGLFWWVLSWRLVVRAPHSVSPVVPQKPRESLTVFKPLPPLEGEGLKIEARGLESFISQLDGASELLLGVHEDDWRDVAPFVEQMRAAYPAANIVVVRRTDIDTMANPKVAWQKLLAPQAKGNLWLWSDADIVAPSGFLDRARDEFEGAGTGMVTFPYAIRTLPHPSALLDALFVNAEFYPGVLFLQRLGPVDFGLGAAMLFSREAFLEKVDWTRLGTALADDFILGQALQPVRLGSITLETVADAKDWSTALAHYLRWKKTVCWCRPGGFAGQIIAMPLFGWIGLVAWHPAHGWLWMGLIGMMQVDVFFAVIICRIAGCPLPARSWVVIELWSLGRIFFWLLSWLPVPVVWRDRLWVEAHRSP